MRELEFSNYVDAVRKKWRWVVLGLVIGVAIGAFAAFGPTSKYSATSHVFVSTQSGASASDLAQGSTFAQDEITSLAAVVTSNSVLGQVASEYKYPGGASGLAANVVVTVPTGSVVLEITAKATSAVVAAELSNSIAGRFENLAPTLFPQNSGQASVKATTIQRAEVPSAPSYPKKKLSFALGGVAGLLVGLAIALLLGLFDTRMKSVDEVEALSPEFPVIAAVPVRRGRKPGRDTGAAFSDGMADWHEVEAYRLLRTNLRYLDVDNPVRRILVTSALPGEGKTTTSINLAAALAEPNRSVVLVDADLRRPSISQYLGLGDADGVAEAVSSNAENFEEYLTKYALGAAEISVLAGSVVPPNAYDIVGSASFDHLMNQLSEKFDFVVVDSPPLTQVSDAAVIAPKVDGVLMVVGAGIARQSEVLAAITQLGRVHARLLGFVMNRVQLTRAYRSYGYYSPDSADSSPAKAARESDASGA